MRSYKANMIPGGVTPTINVSQYDNDYAVTVTLIEGAEIYTPPAGATIRVEGTKPDGHGFEYACTYQGNVVTMPIYTQMTAVAGRFPIELVVYQSGLRVGSCNIIFAVERAPLGEGTDISETVIPGIIAGAQAQADAAAASAASAAEAAAQVLASQIVTDASGSIASFSDGADDIPMQSLIAEITPVQSGSGDPSPTNIRPISGRTGLTVVRSGKNLYAPLTSGGRTNAGITWTYNADGTISATGTATGNSWSYGNDPKQTLLPGTYTASVSAPFGLVVQNFFDGGNLYNGADNTATFTISKETTVIIHARVASGTTVNNATTGIQLEVGTSATAYKPYTGTTIPITWESIAGTVYGGTLDVVSGVLTVDKGYASFDGTENWNWQDGGTYKRAACPLSDVYNPGGRVSVQSNAGTFRASGNDVGTIFASGTTLLYYPEASITSLADYKTWLASNNLHVVYPLATPQTYQLTPTEVRTLLGGNTIYTDAGGVSVEYIADTKLYIDNKIAELQALVLEN